MRTAAYYQNEADTQIRVSDESTIKVGHGLLLIYLPGTYYQDKPLEGWRPSTREAFCKALDIEIQKIEHIERQIDMEENNEIAEAVVIRRAN